MNWNLFNIEDVYQPCISIWSDSSKCKWYVLIIPSTNKLQIINFEKDLFTHILYSFLMHNLSNLKDSINFEFLDLKLRIKANTLCSAIIRNVNHRK